MYWYPLLCGDKLLIARPPLECAESIDISGAKYAYLAGTSQACPHVSALVALCYGSGTCNKETAHEVSRIVNAAAAYAKANPREGFNGDPNHGGQAGRYYGPLINFNMI